MLCRAPVLFFASLSASVFGLWFRACTGAVAPERRAFCPVMRPTTSRALVGDNVFLEDFEGLIHFDRDAEEGIGKENVIEYALLSATSLKIGAATVGRIASLFQITLPRRNLRGKLHFLAEQYVLGGDFAAARLAQL